jgi:prolipoprotein diacylglyceryl transferase
VPVPPSPIAFSIASFEVRWYSLLIALGLAVALFIGLREMKRRGLSDDLAIDMLLLALPLAILGARIYYVIFHWEFYGANPGSILAFREGGLAIHGGLFVGIPAAWLLAKKRKIDFLLYADIAAPCLALAQAIGRWGNYFNQEAYGYPTDLPWGMLIDGVAVHPTFLYESLWNVGLFIILWRLLDKRIYAKGFISLLYVFGYSLGRLWIEQLRTDSEWIGAFRAASVWSLIAILLAGWMLLKLIRQERTKQA